MESIKFETAASNPFSTLIKIAKFLKLNKSKTASAWDYLKRR